MFKENGHIPAIFFATLIAAALIASWVAPERETRLQSELQRNEPSIVKQSSVAKIEKHLAGDMTLATDAAPHIAAPSTQYYGHEEKSVEPDSRQQKPSGGNKMNGTGFFDISLTSLLLAIFMGLTWWNSWSIWKMLKAKAGRDHEISDEITTLTRAAAAMEALATTIVAANATTAEEPVVRKRRKRTPKATANAEAPVENS